MDAVSLSISGDLAYQADRPRRRLLQPQIPVGPLGHCFGAEPVGTLAELALEFAERSNQAVIFNAGRWHDEPGDRTGGLLYSSSRDEACDSGVKNRTDVVGVSQ